jgi:hypothetical protein
MSKRDPIVINTISEQAVGLELTALGDSGNSNNIPLNAANDAWYVPFRIHEPFTVRAAGWHNGSTASGNVDIGIYSENGTRIWSSGSTAQSGTSVVQIVTPTAFTLPPGRYFLAIAADGTTGTFKVINQQERARLAGTRTQTSAFPLPSSATFAATSSTKFRCPWAFISRRATV